LLREESFSFLKEKYGPLSQKMKKYNSMPQINLSKTVFSKIMEH
jgi:hypothetical protein